MKPENKKRSLKKGLMYLLVPVLAFSGLAGMQGSQRIGAEESLRNERKNQSGLEGKLGSTSMTSTELSEFQMKYFLKERQDLMKHILNFELKPYTLNDREKNTFNIMVNKRIPSYMQRMEEASLKTGFPEELLGGKMFKESGGNKDAYNQGSTATGILQILPDTYTSTKNRINWDIRQLKKHIPKEKLDEFSKRSMIEQMTLNPSREGLDSNFSKLINIMGGKEREHEFYIQRLPVALMVYSEFNGRVPYNGKGPESTLKDPKLNIDISAIIGTDYALWLLAYQNKLENKEFTLGKFPDSKITVEAQLNSYIAGIGDSQKRLKRLYDTEKNVTKEKVSEHFATNVFKDAREYNQKVQAAAKEFISFKRIKEESLKPLNPEHRGIDMKPSLADYKLIN